METVNKRNRILLYILGILCFLPGIGAIVGIVVLLFGILVYKDKVLILFGSIGILITLSIYLFLVYNSKYGKGTTRAFAKMSQEQLNGIAKQVEFYKLEYGRYPDSLEQLRINDKFINIVDPLLLRKLNKHINIEYNYQKIGDRYTLFSVGIDGIPNTSDDIYPAISDSGSIKFGLIRNTSR